jgi:hypothetical protein
VIGGEPRRGLGEQALRLRQQQVQDELPISSAARARVWR